jgi:Ran GTPase-activating protein (RanGAP) involved in mRNA processing and transport
LKELDLSWNELGSKEMLELTTVLANNQKLTFLNLSWNFLANSAEHASIPNSWRNELEEMLKNSTEGKL